MQDIQSEGRDGLPRPKISTAEPAREIDDPETLVRELLSVATNTCRERAAELHERVEAMQAEANALEERASVVRSRAHIAASCAEILITYAGAGGKAAENARLNLMGETEDSPVKGDGGLSG